MGEAFSMLRYKYIDSFSSLRTKRQCKDCLFYKTCYWVRTYKKDSNITCNEGKFVYREPEITHENAEWYLHQIGRDVQISKDSVENSYRPGLHEQREFTIDEKQFYCLIMNAYLHFISDWNKDIMIEKKNMIKEVHDIKLKLQKENIKTKEKHTLEQKLSMLEYKILNINSEIERFVKSIIDTRIHIKNNQLQMYTKNNNLVTLIKNKITHNGYTFKEIYNIKDTDIWWAQTTSGS